MNKNHQKQDNKPLISVIVLTCPGRKEELFRCLASIKKSNYKNHELIVVGNGCHPELTKELKSYFPEVRTILLPSNTGCFGFNVGCANATGQYILSLDDDTEIKPETIEKIVKVFEQKPKNVGILAIAAYNPKTKHYYLPSTGKFTGFQAGGAVFKKELFEKTGYYDEDFFLWGEEDDFALRVLDAGVRIDAEKDIIINHYEKIGKLRKRQIFFNARNKAWLNIKHFSLYFFPLLLARDLIWIFLLPYRRKSVQALLYGTIGYLLGYLNFLIPLRKRKVISYEVQKKFLKHYLFSDLMTLQKRKSPLT